MGCAGFCTDEYISQNCHKQRKPKQKVIPDIHNEPGGSLTPEVTSLRRRMINKKTFYHYYAALDDLLAEMQEELSSGYIELVKDYRLPEDAAIVNRLFYEFNEKQGPAYEKITCSTSYSYIRQQMINNVVRHTWGTSPQFNALSREEQNIVLAFVNSCSVSMYRQWVADGKKVPLERIIQMSNELYVSGLSHFFETEKEGKRQVIG